MRPYPKIIIKLHALAATKKRQAALEHLLQTRSTFNKSVMVCIAVSIWGQWTWCLSMLVWRSMMHRLLPWGASDSKANAYHAWDLWRVLYLPTRQCSCSPSLPARQPSETRHLRSFHQTFCHPTAQIWTQFTTNYRNAFCGTWYLSHSDGHNERTVPIVMARSIANARNGHISTFGLTSDVTIVFIDHDFLNVAKISASRMNEWKCNDLKCVQKPT